MSFEITRSEFGLIQICFILARSPGFNKEIRAQICEICMFSSLLDCQNGAIPGDIIIIIIIIIIIMPFTYYNVCKQNLIHNNK
jgi:hypothetical protein